MLSMFILQKQLEDILQLFFSFINSQFSVHPGCFLGCLHIIQCFSVIIDLWPIKIMTNLSYEESILWVSKDKFKK